MSFNPRFSASTIWLAAQISTSASQMGRHAMFGHGENLDARAAGLVEDRRGALGLSE